MHSAQILLVILFIVSFLVVKLGIKTLIYKRQVKSIYQYLKTKSSLKFYGKNCYYSAIGLKKSYPSYPSVLDIYLTDNEVFFIGKKNFPFIFKTYEIPFALSRKPELTKNAVSINRIFKPTKVHLNCENFNIDFVDDISSPTNINFQIDLNKCANWEKLKILNAWIKN